MWRFVPHNLWISKHYSAEMGSVYTIYWYMKNFSNYLFESLVLLGGILVLLVAAGCRTLPL